jgi:arginyl-tRNA synthetase
MEDLKNNVAQVVKRLFGVKVESELERTNKKFGDFASNVALVLAGKIKQPPNEIAKKIADELLKNSSITQANVAGPGFINLRVSDDLLLSQIESEASGLKRGSVIVAETNNPNPFKAMHIGHAFNAILADVIANLLEHSGAEVHRVSYHGDVGLHVGKSMYSILNYINGDVTKLKVINEQDRNNFMARMYAEGAKRYKEDKDAKEQIDNLASESYSPKDKIYKIVYDECKKWSYNEIDKLVCRLGNKPIEKRYQESEAEQKGLKVVRENTGNVFFESEGALVFPGEKYGTFNNVFVASNGHGLYGARDLGLMQLKSADYNPDKSYIVTAEEQKDYFKGVIKAGELCMPELKDVTENISTGMVKLTSGKMSSRTGEVIAVSWLFEQITNAIKERGYQPSDDVVTAAIRYQFLKTRIGSDVVFDIKESTNMQGNTGPYLQYAYARGKSIINKSGDKLQKLTGNLDENEHEFLLKISEYKYYLNKSTSQLMPHHLANYLYELTQSFNSFYENNRVIGHQREAVRLSLLNIYTSVLKDGLNILGIPVLEKM